MVIYCSHLCSTCECTCSYVCSACRVFAYADAVYGSASVCVSLCGSEERNLFVEYYHVLAQGSNRCAQRYGIFLGDVERVCPRTSVCQGDLGTKRMLTARIEFYWGRERREDVTGCCEHRIDLSRKGRCLHYLIVCVI